MIELAAACWKLDPLTALGELLSRGLSLPIELTSYDGHRSMQRTWELRKRLAAFLAEGRQNLKNDAFPTATQALLQITKTGSLDADLYNRLGAIVVATTKNKVRELVGGQVLKRVPRLMFTGDGWQDLLAIPHHTLPNKISGLTLVSESPQGDILTGFLPIVSPDAGLAGLPAWHEGPSPTGDRMFLTTDPALYLHLHARHFRTAGRPLPLLLTTHTQAARTTAVGRFMRERPVTVIGRQNELPELLRLGRLCSGDVVQHDVKDAVGLPQAFLQSLLRNAHSWSAVLQYNLLHLDATAAASLVKQVEITSTEMSLLAAKASPKLKTRLEQLKLVGDNQGTVDINGKTVRFDNTGWYHESTCICDAHIRFDHRLYLRNGKACYSGQVIRGDRSWPITLKINRNLYQRFFQAVAIELLNHGEVLNFRREWSTRALQIALAAHTPVDKHNVDQVGWDGHNGVLRLPKFTLAMGGKVEIGTVTAFPKRPVTPAVHIPLPGIVAGADFLEVSQQSGHDVIWTIMIGILQQVLAPVLNQRPEGVVLTGEGNQRLGSTISEALGCSRLVLPYATDMSTDRIVEQVEHHGWPLYFDLHNCPHRTAVNNWFDLPGDKNLICSTNWLTAYSLATRGWLVIDCDAGTTVTPASLLAAARLMSSYMHDLFTRNGRPHISADTCRETIASDLSEWCRATFGTPLAVKTLKSLTPYGGHIPLWHGFLPLVEHCIRRSQRIRTVHILTEHPHAVSISFDDLSRVLASQDVPQLDFAAITNSLAETGALLSAKSPDGSRGWTINRNWWERHYAQTRVNPTPRYFLPIAQ